ncbi:MAG: glutaredoxin domain-containing protein [Patescibacteria group bacterium]
MPKVRVFSTPFCPYCVTLKEFLKANKIEFDEFDVAQDEKARDDMIAKSKQMGVPVVEIDDQMIIGFDRQKISELLNIKI